jgi:hypothetical protein
MMRFFAAGQSPSCPALCRAPPRHARARPGHPRLRFRWARAVRTGRRQRCRGCAGSRPRSAPSARKAWMAGTSPAMKSKGSGCDAALADGGTPQPRHARAPPGHDAFYAAGLALSGRSAGALPRMRGPPPAQRAFGAQVVDGRDKPGHDGQRRWRTSRMPPPRHARARPGHPRLRRCRACPFTTERDGTAELRGLPPAAPLRRKSVWKLSITLHARRCRTAADLCARRGGDVDAVKICGSQLF